MTDQRNFDWQHIYKNMKITDMPWFSSNLDSDLQKALDKLGLKSGTFLDLGTGPATQAFQLSKKGFTVTATDISKDAILLAQKAYPDIQFVHDDILQTKLTGKFNFILDRGCFHVINIDKREKYVQNVSNLLNDEGYLFLKCFSNKMPETGFGPHHFSEQNIITTFEQYFIIEDIHDTEFVNENNPRTVKALFVTMRKQEKLKT